MDNLCELDFSKWGRYTYLRLETIEYEVEELEHMRNNQGKSREEEEMAVKAKNKIKHIFVDTDGDCNKLIPLFLEAGVNGLYPMEASAGMDIIRARKEYPQLKMFGGVSKYAVANGGKELDDALGAVELLLKQGGYVPFIDHSVPDLVSFEHFSDYRTRLNRIIDRPES